MVSVRTAVGVGGGTDELCGAAEGFLSAVVFSEFCVVEAADGFEAGGISRRAGGSTDFGCATGGAEAVAADEEESGRCPSIFGSAKMATITNSPAATGTT